MRKFAVMAENRVQLQALNVQGDGIAFVKPREGKMTSRVYNSNSNIHVIWNATQLDISYHRYKSICFIKEYFFWCMKPCSFLRVAYHFAWLLGGFPQLGSIHQNRKCCFCVICTNNAWHRVKAYREILWQCCNVLRCQASDGWRDFLVCFE